MAQSILTVVTPATNQNLTELSTVKDELGITTNDLNGTLQRWIKETSAQIKAYCRRTFAQETVQERWRWDVQRSPWERDSTREALTLRRRPVSVIVSVTEDGDTTDPTLYELDAENGFLYRLCGVNDGIEATRQLWRGQVIDVIYTAGWELPVHAPELLEQACLKIIAHRWLSRNRDPQLRRQNVPGVLEQEWWVAGPAQQGLPPEIQVLLDPYREDVV